MVARVTISDVLLPVLAVFALVVASSLFKWTGRISSIISGQTEVNLREVSLRLDEVSRRAQELATASQQPKREPVMVLDYVDRGLLEDLARQKDLQVDVVRWEAGTSDAVGEATTTETGVDVGPPGVSLKAGATESRSRERVESRGRSEDVQYNTRTLVTSLIEALDKDSELRTDLALVPEAAEGDAFLIGALMVAYDDWGLEGLENDDSRKRFAEAIDTIVDEATVRVTSAKEDELRRAVPQRGEVAFALAETEWSVHEDADGWLLLQSEWLVDAHGGRVDESVLIPGLLEVPLERAKLSSMGRQRLKPSGARWLRVLGQIDVFEEGSIKILPIAVWAV